MRAFLLLAVVSCAAAPWLAPALTAQSAVSPPPAPQAAGASPRRVVDVFAADSRGRAVTSLGVQDVRITFDNQPCRVVSVRYVHRGPGAEAAARLAEGARSEPPLAERSRTILVAIDESSIARGNERAVVTAVSRVLDELGGADQGAVVSLPQARGPVVLSGDPSARWASTATVAGRALAAARVDTTEVPSFGLPGTPTEEAGRGERRADPRDSRPAAVADRQPGQPADAASASPDGVEAARFATSRALPSLLDGVRGMPGLKSVVLFRGADTPQRPMEPPDSSERQARISAATEAAARSRAVVHLVEVGAASRRRAADDELAALALATGGTVTEVRKADDAREFDTLRTALAGGYVVEVEGPGGDVDDRSHELGVAAARGGITVRGARRWVRRDDPLPEPGAAAVAPTAAGAPGRPRAVYRDNQPTAAEPRPRRREPRPPDPALAMVLARMSEYLEGYMRDFSNVVAEEDYAQEIKQGDMSGGRARHLRSDVLLLRVGGPLGWLQFRDVFEVDGRAVRDRDERVRKLFLERPGDALEQAERISAESARYNIGTSVRTINLPTLPLAFFAPDQIGGIGFERRGEDVVEGVRAVRVDFEEMRRPTLIRQADRGIDAPASGTVWIDPSTGRILKTKTTVAAGRAEMVATVVYRHGGAIGVWAPAEMEESYWKPGEAITGRATYRNFRRFQVSTDLTIKDERP